MADDDTKLTQPPLTELMNAVHQLALESDMTDREWIQSVLEDDKKAKPTRSSKKSQNIIPFTG